MTMNVALVSFSIIYFQIKSSFTTEIKDNLIE